MSKPCILLAVLALLSGMSANSQLAPGCPAQPATLKAMRNCYRPVLVFTPTANDANFIAQQALLERYAGDMMDRNLLYVPVLVQSLHFESPRAAPYVFLKQPEMNAIRSRFQIDSSQFTVVLVGRDGGEKFRTTTPIPVLRLDELVDAMPMGSREKIARAAKSQ